VGQVGIMPIGYHASVLLLLISCTRDLATPERHTEARICSEIFAAASRAFCLSSSSDSTRETLATAQVSTPPQITLVLAYGVKSKRAPQTAFYYALRIQTPKKKHACSVAALNGPLDGIHERHTPPTSHLELRADDIIKSYENITGTECFVSVFPCRAYS
jgi:hypothetical protein